MNAGVGVLLALLAASEVKDPYADLRRFPPFAVAQFNYCVAQASVRRQERELSVKHDEAPFCYYLTPLALNSPERAYRIETVQQTRHYRDCWQALARASNENRTKEDRLGWLEELQRLLGDDWAAGQMPPCVPLGRFQR